MKNVIKPGLPAPTEDEEQAALIEWAYIEGLRRPELMLLYAVPNGGYRPPRTAAILKRTGVRPGVPDLCLPVARPPYHGLYIELKRRRGAAGPAKPSGTRIPRRRILRMGRGAGGDPVLPGRGSADDLVRQATPAR